MQVATIISRTNCVLLGALLLVKADKLDEKEFRRLHAELQPPANETWASIPWRTSLLEGRRMAAETGKPLFIWAMDGNPLGCT
jgi:hypothetical protein